MPLKVQTMHFRDQNGEEATTSWVYEGTLADDPVESGMIALVEAVTDAEVAKGSITAFDSDISGETIDEPYNDAEDKLKIELMETVSGAIVTRSFPAPLVEAFLDDAETIDQTACADLIAWLETNDRGPNGGVLNFVRGFRDRTRRYKATDL